MKSLVCDNKTRDLVFEYTRDPDLLRQYYRMYEQRFQLIHSAWQYRHAEEDEHDRRAHILIARRGRQCVGGARLSIKTPSKPDALPVELGDFRVARFFPELEERGLSVCQASRFAVLAEYGGGELIRLLQWHLTRKMIGLGMNMFFATAPMSNARVYRKYCRSLGYRNIRIHLDIEIPRYPMCDNIKFYLISGVLDDWLVSQVMVPQVGIGTETPTLTKIQPE